MAYKIATDSGCDVFPSVLEEWGVVSADLTFRFDGDEKEYTNREMNSSEFYARMKAGGISKTSAVNLDAFLAMFRPVLEAGQDLLYIGFDSGISSTSQTGIMAARELQEEFPERTIIAIDTLCASGGQGLVVWEAVQKQREGVGIEENAAFIRDLCPKICQWFTVDDLMYLKRGGRVSAAAAFAGNLLNIRPILHVDDEGKLINMAKARGRKASITALFREYMKRTSDPVKGTPYFINQGDCLKDAELLESMIAEKTGRKAEFIMDIGPVIGSHTGPGILALFFEGTER